MARLPLPPLPVVPPVPTTDIMDGAGNTLGALPISTQDLAQLAAGKKITLSFHTPRMFRETMGAQNFTISLTQDINGNVNVDNPGGFARAVSHLAEISNALKLTAVLTTGALPGDP